MAKRERLRHKPRQRLRRKKPEGQGEALRAKPNRMGFTDLGIKKLNVRKRLAEINAQRRKVGKNEVTQFLIWDEGQKGLALLISAGGTKTFMSQFRVKEGYRTRKLGRFGEMKANDDSENVNVATAREMTRNDRALAKQGVDPRKQAEAEQAAEDLTYVDVVDQFIDKYAKPRQRTWEQTERTLKGTRKERGEEKHGKTDKRKRTGIANWLDRPFADITKMDAYDLLDGLVADGRGPKAQLTLAWLRTLWRWAWKRDLAAAPIMDAVEIEVENRTRKKVFDDNAIKATWNAAERLHNDDPVASAYVKLLVLLAPRKAALAGMRRADLDDPENPTLWTTPPDLVKQNKRAERRDDPRVYLTPLPALAARIIRAIVNCEDDDSDLVFPSSRKSGVPISPTGPLTHKLIERGAPADFQYHGWRHTITSWLQDQGYDKFDRGLLLNHAEAGVTAGYSHGYALDRKRALLEEWAAHVAELILPEDDGANDLPKGDNVVPIRDRTATA